jgi:hypothetical protein
MKANVLLSKLDGVKQTGADRWRARCPSHGSKSLTLVVRQMDDGRVLLKCHAGCGAAEVLGAVGLEFDALFPDNPQERVKRERSPFNAHDVLAALSDEARVLAMGGAWLNQGIVLDDEGRARMVLAASRVEAARSLTNGER